MDVSPQSSPFLGILVATPGLLIIISVWYSVQKQTYWKKVGIPYVKPIPIFGSVYDSISKPLQDTELERYNKYGRIYGHYEGNNAVLSLAEPNNLRHVLVKDFHAFTKRRCFETGDKIFDSMVSNLQGEDWKRVRTIITPTFTTGKIKRMMKIFKECSRTLVENFKKATETGEPVETKSIYGAFTMDIIASSAFSTKIDSHNDPNNKFVQKARNVFMGMLNWRFVLFILFPELMKFFGISAAPPGGLDFFKRVALQILEERKRTQQTRNDFLQLLMDMAEECKSDMKDRDEGDIVENYGREENGTVSKDTTAAKKTLSLDELVAQCIVFFLAGYDTAASTLAFVSYCLALNPEVQEKLIEELDGALNDSNGELTYEAIQSMKYLDNVISETLRIYPPAIKTERVADEDYELAGTGLTIPKGMIVTVPIYAMHRDPKLFPEPEKFDPDRFTPEERAKRSQFTYMPFGAGPRNCIGTRFALMEIKVGLVHVLSNFRIKSCPQTKIPLEFHAGQSLLQPKEVTVALEVRKDTAVSL